MKNITPRVLAPSFETQNAFKLLIDLVACTCNSATWRQQNFGMLQVHYRLGVTVVQNSG